MGSLNGKSALITGATSGIGLAVAMGLAREGASVTLVARDPARGASAMERVNDAGGGPHDLLLADLATMASVRGAVTAFQSQHRRLHILVNSASAFLFRRELSPDGLELMFATNHLGPFLLTHLLLDSLRLGAPSQILTITAPSTVRLDFNDLQGERHFRASQAFGASKAANLLFAFALARRIEDSGVTSNAIHPGLVRSGLMRHAPAPIRWVTYLASAPPGRAVGPIVRIASAPEFGSANGQFFLRGKAIDPPPYTRDQAIQDRLWTVSARLVGLSD